MKKTQKSLCTTCEEPIHTTKEDVPRIATKPYCCKCYYLKKVEMKQKPRFDGSGRKFTFKRWKPAWQR